MSRGHRIAYDEKLADRTREALSGTPGLTEKKMFGGLCFLVRGNVCCGIAGDTLMVRVGPDAYEEALAQPHVREMDFTGRPLNGMVYVDGAGVKSDPGMAEWTGRGVAFASTLPAKPPVKPKKSDAERRGASR